MNDSEIKQIYTQINYLCTYLSWGYELNQTLTSYEPNNFCKVKSYKFNRFSIVQSVAPRDNLFARVHFAWSRHLCMRMAVENPDKNKRMIMRVNKNRFHRQETGLTHPFSRMSGGSKNLEAARRVSFLFPICLGRSKESLLAGYSLL